MAPRDPMKVSPLPAIGAGVATFVVMVGLGFLLVTIAPSTPEADAELGGLTAKLSMPAGAGVAIGTHLWRSHPRTLGIAIVAITVALALTLFLASFAARF